MPRRMRENFGPGLVVPWNEAIPLSSWLYKRLRVPVERLEGVDIKLQWL